MVLVVAIALVFGTSVDPYSLMILATATYFLVWLASFGVTWYGRRRPGPTADADPGGSGDSREHDLPGKPVASAPGQAAGRGTGVIGYGGGDQEESSTTRDAEH
jgi:hypothetical protein